MTPEEAKERTDFTQAAGRLFEVLSPRSSSSAAVNQNFSPFLIVIAIILFVTGVAYGVIIDERAESRLKQLLSDQAHREELAAERHKTEMALTRATAEVAATRLESQIATAAANRRADMAQLIALQSDAAFAKAQASTAKTLANEIDKKLGQRIAILEARQP